MTDAVLELMEDTADEIHDVAMLDPLNESTLMTVIKKRYEEAKTNHGLIYTRAGDVVVAVNPFTSEVKEELYSAAQRSKYSRRAALAVLEQKLADPATPAEQRPSMEEALKRYKADQADPAELRPHVYEVSALAYHSMTHLGQSQAIVINGESGAGKTETTKLLLEFLTEVSGGVSSVAERLHDSSPVLEAFGNAKTLRNDNSSRFGKLIRVHFGSGGTPPCGSNCEHNRTLLAASLILGSTYGRHAEPRVGHPLSVGEVTRRDFVKEGAGLPRAILPVLCQRPGCGQLARKAPPPRRRDLQLPAGGRSSAPARLRC